MTKTNSKNDIDSIPFMNWTYNIKELSSFPFFADLKSHSIPFRLYWTKQALNHLTKSIKCIFHLLVVDYVQ